MYRLWGDFTSFLGKKEGSFAGLHKEDVIFAQAILQAAPFFQVGDYLTQVADDNFFW